MLGFVLRRLAHGLLLLLGVSILTFLLTELAPGDFLDDATIDPDVPSETVTAMRERLALDGSVVERYLRWIGALARGDLGVSLADGTPVTELLWRRGRHTLLLSAAATFAAWMLALPLGIWAAERRGRWVEALAGTGSSLLLAVPDLVLALALLMVAVRTGWLPTGGLVSVGYAELGPLGKLGDLARHLLLPVTALTLAMLPALFRHVHASMHEILSSSFMRAVRAYGIPRRRRLLRYALPAAANPLVSLFGLSVASLLSASLLVEVVMTWPGIGPLLLQAVLARDVYVVIGVVLASTVLLLIGNLVADLLLYAVDPRIRRDE